MANDTNGGYPKDYLDAPDTAGRPMALVSMLLIFVVIALLGFLLFSAGRWGYDKLTNNDSQESSEVAKNDGSKPTDSQQTTNGTESSEGAGQAGTSDQNSAGANNQNGSSDQNNSTTNDQNDTNTSNSSTNQAGSTSGNQAGSSSQAQANNAGENQASTNQNSSGQQANNQAVAPVTGPAPETVPNTGPGDLLAIFVVASTLGALAHNRLTKNKI